MISEERNLSDVYNGKYVGKRVATQEDIDEMCNLLETAICVKDIPELNPDVYFLPAQIREINKRIYINNPFINKLNSLEKEMKEHAQDAGNIKWYLETGSISEITQTTF